MDANRNKGGASRALVFAAIGLLVLLPFLYVLSTGPATWLYDHGYVSAGTLGILYAPLGWMNKRCKPLENFQIWYCQFFRSPQLPEGSRIPLEADKGRNITTHRTRP